MRLVIVLLTTAVVTVVSGCGGATSDMYTKNRPKTAPASGSVKWNGSPVGGAMVVFAPESKEAGKNVAAAAMTDSNGNFELQAFPPLKGAVPGKYKVSITKKESATPAATGPDAHDAPPPPPAKSLIPEKYSDAEQSGLLADIPEGGRNDLHFDLK